MVGLVRAFMVAGAARVVASLWPVDDEITTLFMAHFYRSLSRGTPPAASVRFAQIEVMRLHPHPFHWAAFALHGRW
jgi:CHAT domain-containing protein